MKTASLSVLVASCIAASSAANILAIFTTISPSHHIWNSPLVVTLANRGHNVTVLSPEGQKKHVPNLTDLVVEATYDVLEEDSSYTEMTDISQIQWFKEVFIFFSICCNQTLQSDAFKQLMSYPPETKFDLIIMESIGVECLFGSIPKFGNPPIIAVNGFSIPTWLFEMTGTPNVWSHMPHFLSVFTDHMTLAERIQNMINNIYANHLYHNDYLPEMNKAAQQYFGSKTPAVEVILQNISLVMANFHPALDYPWATAPNLISIGGIQIQDPQPLPSDLQKFLDDATEGAIFFSLGSNVRSDKMSPDKIKAILGAFSDIAQQVLWKYESDLSELPKNVKIGKWLPQRDILAHPNIKVFITHSGLLSTHEAVHRGVPVIGIPFMVDQHINIRKIKNHGAGIVLEYRYLTKESLLGALHTVLNNPSYRENMQALSARFQDNPQSPLERAVFWTEYVLRHKGAPHLRSAALDLNFVQYFLLDVIACLVLAPTLLIAMLYFVCHRKQSGHKAKQKKS